MSIRKKLLLSNFGMVLIPLVLFFLCIMLLYGLFMRDISTITGYYGADGATREGIAVVRDKFEQRNELFAGIRFMVRYNPEMLTDGAFLNDMDATLGDTKAGIVITKNGAPAFVSAYVKDLDIGKLESFDAERDKSEPHHGDVPHLRNGDRQYSFERLDFTFSDGKGGSVYFLTDMSPLASFVPKMMPTVAGVLLLILCLTNGALTIIVSRSFIKPLYALKGAAEQIKEGNLDHGLTLGRKDEFGEVGAAFEEMRVRLKQSIGLQLQYEENRKELLSNISHDLKTPITAIKGCVEGLLDGIADTPEKRNSYLRMIGRKAEDMDREIDELFLFSKLDLKRVPFHFERLELASYLRDHEEELRLQPRSADVQISYERDSGRNVYVQADREKLHRVIQNIVDNSIKYMDKETKRIDIVLSESPGEAVVRISDNGAGIDPEALPHIFDRFYRADPSRNGSSGGSGLGLAIVKQIVEEHGGRVWAESAPGAGTSILFTLPITSSAEKGGVRE
ncbi:HAMP domain-containing histidine kinase [Paenibacillus mesophilus]|uniref:sensor histidine kinase n=1 Tax=Paenibacillus mesophilus TaxID=2582849 RepID=UPI00110E2DED|nr:HAMP domain-containing sensor histidine kinase [Paenibacillus mesophilus]TMV44962.1 HAMP domain-containing histidine kinase [Paenibacillus mesophilus]